MTIDGGATGGYCATGSCVIDDAAEHQDEQRDHPREDRAVDEERAMACALLRAAGRRGGRRPRRRGARRAPCRRLPRHRLHRRAGRASSGSRRRSTCSPAFRPSSTTHWPSLRRADLDRPRRRPCRRRRPPSRVSPLGAARHRLLRQQRSPSLGLRLLEPHAHVHARQQQAVRVRHLGAQRDLARGRVDRQVGEQQLARLRVARCRLRARRAPARRRRRRACSLPLAIALRSRSTSVVDCVKFT